jgi:hypothetical protein
MLLPERAGRRPAARTTRKQSDSLPRAPSVGHYQTLVNRLPIPLENGGHAKETYPLASFDPLHTITHKSQPPKPVDLRRRASVERNEGAGELDEGEIVLGFTLPADEKTAISVVPAVGALDDPAPRFFVNTAEQRLLASPTDVGNDSTPTCLLLAVGIVVAFVEAQVFGAPWATRARRTMASRVSPTIHLS